MHTTKPTSLEPFAKTMSNIPYLSRTLSEKSYAIYVGTNRVRIYECKQNIPKKPINYQVGHMAVQI